MNNIIEFEEEFKKQNVMEGFLIKQGHVRKNWKTRWFKLSDSSLRYYVDKKHGVPLGRIPLRKANLSKTARQTDRQNLFILTTESGVSYPLQAPTPAEYNIWTMSIQTVIDGLESAESSCDSPPTSPLHSGIINSSIALESETEIINELYKTPEQNVQTRSQTINGVYYDNVITGKELLRWMFEGLGISQDEAEDTVRSLMLTGNLECMTSDRIESSLFSSSHYFRLLADQNVIIKSMTSNKVNESCSEEQSSPKQKNRSPSKSNEQSLPNDLPLGEIVKQGILIKRGHIITSWKARCFVLQKFPASLSYFDPTKKILKTINTLDLAGASVFPVPEFAAKTTLKINKPPDFLFCIKLANSAVYLISAASQDEMNDWVQAIQDYCRSKPIKP